MWDQLKRKNNPKNVRSSEMYYTSALYFISPKLLFFKWGRRKEPSFSSCARTTGSDFIHLWRKFWSWKKFHFKTLALFWAWAWCWGLGGQGAGRREWKLPRRRWVHEGGDNRKSKTVSDFLAITTATQTLTFHNPWAPFSRLTSYSHLVEKETNPEDCNWKCHQAPPFLLVIKNKLPF